LEEEWPAELHSTIESRPLLGLREAASLYRAASAVAAELEPAPAAVSVPQRVQALKSAFGERAGRIVDAFERCDQIANAFAERTFDVILRISASLQRSLGIPQPVTTAALGIALIALAVSTLGLCLLWFLEVHLGL
jgi:hypothetical protein